MRHSLLMDYENTNKLNIYIEYFDNQNNSIDKIKLDNDDYEIYKDEKFIYFTKKGYITKVFDIFHKSYIKDKLTMYNEFNKYLNKIKPKKNKTYSHKMN